MTESQTNPAWEKVAKIATLRRTAVPCSLRERQEASLRRAILRADRFAATEHGRAANFIGSGALSRATCRDQLADLGRVADELHELVMGLELNARFVLWKADVPGFDELSGDPEFGGWLRAMADAANLVGGSSMDPGRPVSEAGRLAFLHAISWALRNHVARLAVECPSALWRSAGSDWRTMDDGERAGVWKRALAQARRAGALAREADLWLSRQAMVETRTHRELLTTSPGAEQKCLRVHPFPPERPYPFAMPTSAAVDSRLHQDGSLTRPDHRDPVLERLRREKGLWSLYVPSLDTPQGLPRG